jgi:hypothetical protein
MQESLICAPAVKGAWKHFPHEVARDTEVTAALLVVLAYRATFAGQYCLRPELLARLVSKGLSRDVVRSALALGAERGYLKRHQGPGAAPGKFGKVREVLDLPKCGESGRAGQMIKRSWFDGTLSVKDLAALLYLRAGTGKGNRSYTRELQERFGWSRSTAEGVIRTLTRRGLIEKHVTRNAAGQFKATTYSASQIAADRLSPSTAQKTVHVAAGDAKTGHLLTSSTPLDELSTRDNPKRTASAASYASPLRGQCATPQEAEAQEDFQCEVQDDVRSDAHCSQALLGWIEGAYEGDIQAALEDADSDVLAEIRAAVPDDRLSELVLDATGRRVAAEIISPPGLYAIRYLAAKLVLDDEDPEQAVVRVLNAMWARVGRHPGVWLNSLKLIGMRIGGELLGSGFDALYAGSGRPKFCVVSSSQARQAAPADMVEALIEADGAKTLSATLLSKRPRLANFLQKQASLHEASTDEVLEVMKGVLWRHMLDGKDVGSIHTWEYFAPAIAQELSAQEMAEHNLRPGDVPGWRGLWDGSACN